jgi:hypothetical protein
VKSGWIVLGLALIGLPAAAAEDEARIRFLDAAEAAEAIVEDAREPYFDRLQPLEMSAKTGKAITGETLAEQRAECRRRYAEATLDFTTDEIAAVVRVVSRLQPHLRAHYPRVAFLDWSFIKVGSHIEGGLPHTRGMHIVLSSKLLDSTVEIHKGQREEKLLSIGTQLLHEQMHVFQRRNPDLFQRLYTREWGFKRVDSVGEHSWLLAHQLVNPDGLGPYWIYPVRGGETATWIWPTVVLGESRGMRRLLGVPSMTRDMRLVAVELDPAGEEFAVRLDAQGMPVVRRLLSFQAYRERFPFAFAPYHPNEIAAEGFARIVIAEIGNGPAPGDPETAALRRWFAEHLD